MHLRHLLPILLIPVLSAACCCGPPPTHPDRVALAGVWELEGAFPTGSTVGALTEVSVTFSGERTGDDYLEGRTGEGETLRATVVIRDPDPLRLRLEIDRTGSAATAFRVEAEGTRSEAAVIELDFRTAGGEALGSGVLRRR